VKTLESRLQALEAATSANGPQEPVTLRVSYHGSTPTHYRQEDGGTTPKG
jgi:hypothetical protein